MLASPAEKGLRGNRQLKLAANAPELYSHLPRINKKLDSSRLFMHNSGPHIQYPSQAQPIYWLVAPKR
jgi:hypothetical protein